MYMCVYNILGLGENQDLKGTLNPIFELGKLIYFGISEAKVQGNVHSNELL
jgi:hypothetical protein